MLKVNNLFLEIKGNLILDDISFELQEGECLGIIGAIGSGKTFLLDILATLVKPSSGTIEISGYDALKQPKKVRKLIGYVPENFDGYNELLVEEYIELFAWAYQIDRNARAQIISDSLELAGLTEYRKRYLYELSRGEKQRLCWVKSILQDASVLLLDSPILWTDFTQQEEFANLIIELLSVNKVIIAASNNRIGMDKFCSKFGLLENGKLSILIDSIPTCLCR